MLDRRSFETQLEARVTKVRTMEIDTEKVDEAVLALMYLTLHEGTRAWKL